MKKDQIHFNFAIPITSCVAELSSSSGQKMVFQKHPLIIIVLEGKVHFNNLRHEGIYSEQSTIFVEGDSPVLISNDMQGEGSKLLLLYFNKDYYVQKFPALSNAFFFNDTKEQDESLISDILNTAFISMKGIGSHNTLQLLADHLINNLIKRHQFFSSYLYNVDSRRKISDSEEILEKLMIFLDEHYQTRASLQEFAESCHMSSGYVSHLLKKICGKPFQEILSQTRCMKSLEFLLDPGYRFTELAYDIGFSSPSYFLRNFEKIFRVTPAQFRETFCSGNCGRLDVKTDSHFIETQIKQFAHRHHYNLSVMPDTVFTSEQIDLENTKCKYENLLSDMGRISNIKTAMTETAHKAFDEMQKVFRMSIITIDVKTSLFNSDTPNLLSISRNINYLMNIGFSVALETKDPSVITINMISKFLLFYSHTFQDDVARLKILFRSNRESAYKEHVQKTMLQQILSETGLHIEVISASEYVDELDYYPAVYDSFLLAPFAMDELFNPQKWPKEIGFSLIDEVSANGMFLLGGNGLLTWNGIKKPWWHAYMLVAKLRGDIIGQASDHIITHDNGRITILTFNLCRQHPDLLQMIQSKEQLLDIIKERGGIRREHNFHISGLSGKYKITQYTLGQGVCLFSKWATLGFPPYMTGDEEEILAATCQPNITFTVVDAMGALNITAVEESFGVSLIVLEKYSER